MPCCSFAAIPAWLLSSGTNFLISSPLPRVVFQRNNANQAIVPVRALCPALSNVQARLVPRMTGQGTTTEWTVLQYDPAKSQVHGSITGQAGWYNLELRAISGSATVTGLVERVGVGEVFVIVGHSVAAGQNPSMQAATDDRVNTVPLDPEGGEYKKYLETGDPAYLPTPGFVHYGEGIKPAPFGNGNYFWSAFGELVVKKQNVPVLIYNAAFGGTSLEHWAKSAQNIPFQHSFVKSHIRMPYINLRNTLTKYIPLTGIRAVLADQGQNDWPEKNEELVFQNYLTFIKQARMDLGHPELAFVINRQTPFLRDQQIRRVQERMIQTPHCFPGPDYDKLAPDARPDAIHLGLQGQQQAARFWAEALDENFFRKATPWLPAFN